MNDQPSIKWKEASIEINLPAYHPGWQGLWDHLVHIIRGECPLYFKAYKLTMTTTAKKVVVYIDNVHLTMEATHEQTRTTQEATKLHQDEPVQDAGPRDGLAAKEDELPPEGKHDQAHGHRA